jgi:hypothetical protein
MLQSIGKSFYKSGIDKLWIYVEGEKFLLSRFCYPQVPHDIIFHFII